MTTWALCLYLSFIQMDRFVIPITTVRAFVFCCVGWAQRQHERNFGWILKLSLYEVVLHHGWVDSKSVLNKYLKLNSCNTITIAKKTNFLCSITKRQLSSELHNLKKSEECIYSVSANSSLLRRSPYCWVMQVVSIDWSF